MSALCRTTTGCYDEDSSLIFGSKGQASLKACRISGETNWRWRGQCDPYQVEHDRLFTGIRSGEPLNNGDYMARSTMITVMASSPVTPAKRSLGSRSTNRTSATRRARKTAMMAWRRRRTWARTTPIRSPSPGRRALTFNRSQPRRRRHSPVSPEPLGSIKSNQCKEVLKLRAASRREDARGLRRSGGKTHETIVAPPSEV